MRKKLYRVLNIVLPIFVGGGGVMELIVYFSGNGRAMNPVFSVILAATGLTVGIRNILTLINSVEGNHKKSE